MKPSLSLLSPLFGNTRTSHHASWMKKMFLGVLPALLLVSMLTTAGLGAPVANVVDPQDAPKTAEGFSAVPFTSERADSQKYYHWMSSRSLRLDSNKRAHLVYGGDALYYWYNDGTMWRYENIDQSPGVGKYASLALDSNNKPHVSYYDAVNGSLKYARRLGTNWEIFVLDKGSSVPMSLMEEKDFIEAGPEILESDAEARAWRYTLPGSGNPYDGDYELEPKVGDVFDGEPYLGEGLPVEIEALLVEEKESIINSVTSIDETGRGLFTSIAINSFGNPSISYYDSINGDLKYAAFTGSTWDIRTLDSTGDVGSYSSLALDSSGYPYISYYGADKGDLKFIRFTGTAWTSPVVLDSGGDTSTTTNKVGMHTSIAVDGSKNVHISYYDATQGNLKYARTSSGSWSIYTVDTAGDVGLYTSLAVDSNAKAYISYYHATNADLRFAVCASGSCSLQNVLVSGYVGQYSSLALDGTYPHITFYDSGTGHLLYAQPSANTTWAIHILDSSGDVGLFTSIALDNSGLPRIAYFDDLRDDLKYAAWNGSQWQSWIIDSVGEIGLYTSLAFNKTNNYPAISYYDATNKYLKFAQWTGTAWALTVLDTGDAGTFSSLAFDSTGKPRIAYCRGKGCLSISSSDPAELKIIMWSGTEWVKKTIDTGGVGPFLSMKLGTDNSIHVSYYDVVNRRLKYAKGPADGSSWTVQVADSNAKVGLHTSLALDSSNRPHISYFEDYMDRLKYAYWNNAWYHEIVDTESPTGFYSSLAVDINGVPHISYYDFGRRSLKYATRLSSNSWAPQVVDNVGEVGQFSSITLSSGKSPIISYYDATNADLKVSRGFPAVLSHKVFLPHIGR